MKGFELYTDTKTIPHPKLPFSTKIPVWLQFYLLQLLI